MPIATPPRRQGRAPSRVAQGFLGHPLALAGLLYLLIVSAGAIAAPLVAPSDPVKQHLNRRLSPPAWEAGGSTASLLGTDQLGRDILSRLIFGARISLTLGLSCTLGAAAIGVTLGLIAALRGGLLEVIVMRVVDAQLAFPFIVLAITVVAVFGPRLPNLFILLIGFGWAPFARLVRGEALVVRRKEYIEAARSIGASDRRIAFRHLLPNVMSPVIVMATFTVAQIVILESSLSFLGVGVRPPTASWGAMLNDGQNYLDTAWWLATFPGLALMLTVLALNLVGNALRNALDPRYQG